VDFCSTLAQAYEREEQPISEELRQLARQLKQNTAGMQKEEEEADSS
jgi:hypothetical protein